MNYSLGKHLLMMIYYKFCKLGLKSMSYLIYIVFPSNISISTEARDFIRKMLEKNYNKRISLSKAMAHEFVKNQILEHEKLAK